MDLRIISIAVFVLLLISACTKNVDRTGCTDPLASNYNTLADVDDGSCEYIFLEQVIWRDGEFGAWDDDHSQGGIAVLPCIGTYEIETIGVDTSGNPKLAIVVSTDSTGEFGIVGKLVNSQDARAFVNGFLRFDAILPSGSPLVIMDVSIHGANCFQLGDCAQICRSGSQQTLSFHLNDTAFTEVALPILDFPARKLALLETMLMIRSIVPLANSEVLILDNIRWTNR